MKHILLHTLLILVFNLLIANLTFGYGHKTVAEEGQTDDSDTMESLGDLNEKNSSSSSDSTLQKRGDSNLNTNQKIRFRSLSGRYTSDIQESSSSTSSIIWYDLGVVAYGNSTFVIVGSSGNNVATSSDGTTWDYEDIGKFWGVIYANTTFMAVGSGQTGLISTSSDGISWSSTTSSTRINQVIYIEQ